MAIYVFTGQGAGKTTAALGMALRELGHDYAVIVIQFLKWWKNTGEYKFKNKNYEIYQFGRKGWHGLGNLDNRDKKLAEKAIEFAKKSLKKKPSLLILDELNLALHCKLLEIKEVINFLKKAPSNIDIVITGRNAPKEIIAIADCVNEVKMIKCPKKIITKKGISY